ncbi:L-threonylcarbamoyladenylate synthase [Sandaracinobacteroides hominis]|uniref:L-threonylcarbamoyladenylate synthase n=1 Tax=Sandaracinobacteroides hominis TaxID=2780086 RepID=UPI0018F4CE8A|nr:L-threonylcarbamoyladenylate synthase [Sandaracinobacteroides hominis]
MTAGETTRIRLADMAAIAEAAALLDAGELVAIPTETVYGLAADATNGAAVARIYAAKGRPSFNPLIVHLPNGEAARGHARMEPLAQALAARFWPGPLTLVLPRLESSPVAALVTAGLPTVALRVPAHRAMQAVLAALGRPLAAPSANRSGRLSPTHAAHVRESLAGRVPLILDAGPTSAGLESSIVSVVDGKARLLRQGAISREQLEEVTGPLEIAEDADPVAAPGMLLNHYAPALPLRLNAASADAREFLIGFGAVAGDANLSPSGDLVEAAANLFDFLHRAQSSGRTAIAVAPIPTHGLGAAINDRLKRAAAPL